jgi:hypothetical protein
VPVSVHGVLNHCNFDMNSFFNNDTVKFVAIGGAVIVALYVVNNTGAEVASGVGTGAEIAGGGVGIAAIVGVVGLLLL